MDILLIASNSSAILRTKSGISVDECARLCITEEAFDCQVMTYGPGYKECKWTSLLFLADSVNNETMYLKSGDGYTLFTSIFLLLSNSFRQSFINVLF